ASFLVSNMRPRGAGQSARISNSFTTTRSPKAGTLRPGNSLCFFQKRFARASGHFAKRTEDISARSRECADLTRLGTLHLIRTDRERRKVSCQQHRQRDEKFSSPQRGWVPSVSCPYSLLKRPTAISLGLSTSTFRR